MLTRKQYDLLMFIHSRIQETGVSPSFEEMKEALELKSKSGIHRLITALEERSYIRRLPHRARALEVLKLPENHTSHTNRAGTPKLSVISGDKDLPAKQPEEVSGVRVPLLGRIAAGSPIEALLTPADPVVAPPGMVANGEHYALEIKGDSMIEAGILEGDVVVIRQQDDAQNGEIVVALVDGESATLKYLRRKGASVALQPANAAYEAQVLPANRVQVQGKMVGLIRTY